MAYKPAPPTKSSVHKPQGASHPAHDTKHSAPANPVPPEPTREVTTAQEGPPPRAVDNPNIAPLLEPKLTDDEKKAKDEYAKLEKEGIDKVATVNQQLAKAEDDSGSRLSYEVRNGEIVYWWVNTVKTRMLTADELDSVAGGKAPEKGSKSATANTPPESSPNKKAA